MLSEGVLRCASSASNSVFDTKVEVKRLDRSPIVSVIAKPRIGPVPNWNRNAAEMSAAMCVSSSVRKTRPKPAWTAGRARPCSGLTGRLLDHLGGLQQDFLGHGQPERLGGLEVDHEVERARLLDDWNTGALVGLPTVGSLDYFQA